MSKLNFKLKHSRVFLLKIHPISLNTENHDIENF